MTETTGAPLTPRQEECLRLVWERQATSKEIALALGISKKTVDLHLAQAVAALGAADRRDAARLAFGPVPTPEVAHPQAFRPGTVSLEDADPVSPPPDPAPPAALSTKASPPVRPWRTADRPRNTMTLMQILSWMAMAIIGSLVALAASASIGSAMPGIWRPVLVAVRRLTL